MSSGRKDQDIFSENWNSDDIEQYKALMGIMLNVQRITSQLENKINSVDAELRRSNDLQTQFNNSLVKQIESLNKEVHGNGKKGLRDTIQTSNEEIYNKFDEVDKTSTKLENKLDLVFKIGLPVVAIVTTLVTAGIMQLMKTGATSLVK